MKLRKLLLALPMLLVLVATDAYAQARAHGDGTDKLGNVRFPTSCDPRVQPLFERGVAMLHSYWFVQARKTFEAVLQQDPTCAIAYWGIALDLLGNTLVAPPPLKQAAEAWQALEKARAIGAKTERERDWIEALSAYYRDYETVPANARLQSYKKALEGLTQRDPKDPEAWAFYALALQAAASHADRTYADQLKSAEILERLFKQHPQHPGVAHYLVHAYDFPPLAQKGVPIAKIYGELAPAAPHARHMPSHIYSMVGMWQESIASNLSAMAVQPDYYHAADFAVYAYLQLAQDEKAKALIQKATTTQDTGTRRVSFVNFTALNAMPARYVLERGDWAGAAALPFTPTEFPQADSLTHFARGVGMARSGNVEGAKREIQAIEKLRAALQKPQPYWAERSEEHALAVAAWVAHAEGAGERAVKLMRTAADLEDAAVKHVAMENRLYPYREQLGELLLETRQPAAALREFELSMKENPNRYRAYYNAARAADASGARQKAQEYYAKLVELARHADTGRGEVERAKAYLARR